MKRPSVSFDKEAIVDVLLRHVEKLLVVIVGFLAFYFLVLGGIDAVRRLPPSEGLLPPAVLDQANRAAQNIEKAKRPPADAVSKTDLAALVEPWRTPGLANPTAVALLNKPLFDEKAKRTKPAVLPIEDLRAVAGIAVLPVKNVPAAIPVRNAADLDDRPKGGGRGRGNPREPEEKNPSPPEKAVVKVRLVPYCIVTGLIPFARQTEEYSRRFEQTGFQDPKRDVPLWSEYLIERSVVRPDGREVWERIDLKAAKAAQKDWAAIHSQSLPTEVLLGTERSPGISIDYVLPLPQRVGEPWGSDAIHPWFVEHLKKVRARRLAADRAAAEGAGSGGGANPPDPAVFQSSSEPPHPPAPEPRPANAARPVGGGFEYRLLRFVDTAVEIGTSYRYRVRLSVWNPNYKLDTQYLADATLAGEAKLASPTSNATAAVRVPLTTTLLVRALQKSDIKRLKPGAVEVLVLGEDSKTGDYALRSLLTEPGGLVNVDKRLNRPGDNRTRGEEIFTGRVLIDMRGRQDDRYETRANKPPPEPLEMLFLGDDGTFEVASAADSEMTIGRHVATLPAPEEAKPVGRDQPEQPQAPVGNPFGNPFRQ